MCIFKSIISGLAKGELMSTRGDYSLSLLPDLEVLKWWWLCGFVWIFVQLLPSVPLAKWARGKCCTRIPPASPWAYASAALLDGPEINPLIGMADSAHHLSVPLNTGAQRQPQGCFKPRDGRTKKTLPEKNGRPNWWSLQRRGKWPGKSETREIKVLIKNGGK